MALGKPAAEDGGIVSRDRVIDTVRALLRRAIVVERRFTVEELAKLSGVSLRAMRTYMANDPDEVRQPPLSASLSIAVVLGSEAVNSVLALIGYVGARPSDEAAASTPAQIVANVMSPLAVIALAAADNRFDHVERPACREAADKIIAELMPISSQGEAE